MNEFKKLHDGSKLLTLPNAWDAGSARLFESLGAPAIATTSAGVAWAQGYADNDQLPVDNAVAVAANIARVLTVPLSVDFENGYSSDPQQVARNVLRLIEAGVAGINLEDGNDAPSLLADKIRAIRQLGKDIFINVRTDVYLRGLAPEGERVAEVLKRAALYKDAGADGLFVPGICKADEIKTVAASAGLPLNVMDWPGLPSHDELHQMGVARFSAGSGIAQALWAVAAGMAKDFLATGNAGPLIGQAMPYGDLQALFVK
ncbi:2-Methylisocitrate lyase, PEP mutase family [Duganella sp. CF402]|uniref:isocitrate lyase/PEP mutase family protein n=1 Tax=unclassified Duganella TaxID=2636909 RepID=UPI0008C73BF8|nr:MULTISPECIES: isocitrate lyase/phosphoenolpyruvate mutase family protein [unclassified Duganella]RZT04164.1 2-methylisocitrate lyase-like PEP mutase family enzyme [Duganella sp. BK701]SEM45756.1 2-Methylisocitrate lyase, PEP mutase family [Duganella sp. CF402]